MRALRIARGMRPGLAAALWAFAVDGLYIALIAQQDTGITGRVVFVAVSIAGAGVACAAAEFSEDFAGGVLAAWAAATLWIWTMLAILSIGILVAPAGVLAVAALTRRNAGTLPVASGIGAALVLVAAGLAWTPA